MAKGNRRRPTTQGVVPCKSIVDLLAVFQHELRLRILYRLAESPQNVQTLAKGLQVDAKTVSHHLRPLWLRGLVRLHRLGQKHVYSLSDRIATELRGDTLHLSITSGEGARLSIETLAAAARSESHTRAG